MRYLTGLLAAIAVLAVASPSQAGFTGRYTLKSVDAHDCKGGLHAGYAAISRMLIGCLVKAAAGIDLNAPDAGTQAATVWEGQVTPELKTAWQANPKSALGKIDGYVPVRMGDISVTATGFDVNHVGYCSFSGRWVSVANGQEKSEPITILMTEINARKWLSAVTRP